jgi:methionyl aminopeptidase
MAIALRKPVEIEKLRKAGQIVGQTLHYLQNHVQAGMTLKEVDAMGEAYLRDLGAEPAFKGLYGFPSAVCTSLNEVIIHGVPTDTVLQNGDILGIDIGTKLDGYYGDAAITMPIGKISEEDQALIQCSMDALDMAIEAIRPGMRFKELSRLLEQFITDRGYVPLRDYSGHGIGTQPHDEPSIPNYLEGKPNQGPKIKNGMVFCIEPMICQKGGRPIVWDDAWSVESEDGLRTAHYEHQVAVIDGRAVILTEP